METIEAETVSKSLSQLLASQPADRRVVRRHGHPFPPLRSLTAAQAAAAMRPNTARLRLRARLTERLTGLDRPLITTVENLEKRADHAGAVLEVDMIGGDVH